MAGVLQLTVIGTFLLLLLISLFDISSSAAIRAKRSSYKTKRYPTKKITIDCTQHPTECHGSHKHVDNTVLHSDTFYDDVSDYSDELHEHESHSDEHGRELNNNNDDNQNVDQLDQTAAQDNEPSANLQPPNTQVRGRPEGREEGDDDYNTDDDEEANEEANEEAGGDEDGDLKSGGSSEHEDSSSHEHSHRPHKTFKKPPIVVVKKIISASTTTPVVG